MCLENCCPEAYEGCQGLEGLFEASSEGLVFDESQGDTLTFIYFSLTSLQGPKFRPKPNSIATMLAVLRSTSTIFPLHSSSEAFASNTKQDTIVVHHQGLHLT